MKYYDLSSPGEFKFGLYAKQASGVYICADTTRSRLVAFLWRLRYEVLDDD